MNEHRSVSRRAFLGQGAVGAVAVGWSRTAVAGVPGASASGIAHENPWRYSVEHLQQVDPKRIGYRREGGFRIDHSSPRRVVCGPDGRLYVAAGPAVLVYSEAGQRVAMHRIGDQVRCLRVTPDGRIWIGLRDQVRVLSREGEIQARWPAFTGKPFLTGLAVDGDDVYVADSGNRVVYRCDPRGGVILRLGEKNPDRHIPGLVLPSPFLDVEVGADGLIRVNNAGRHRIETYTRDGDLELSWGRPGMAIESFCGCCNPVGLALREDGGVVTAEKGLPRVKVFRSSGEFETVVAAPVAFAPVASDERAAVSPDEGHDGLDVAVDGTGRVIVLDRVGSAIHLFQKTPDAG